MSTQGATERPVGERVERAGVRLTGRRFVTKRVPLTTEFWAMVGVIRISVPPQGTGRIARAPRAFAQGTRGGPILLRRLMS